MTKLDYNRRKNQISGRYFYSKFVQPADFVVFKRNILAMDPNANQVRVQTLALNDTYSASPALLFNT